MVSVAETPNSNHRQLIPCLEKIGAWMANCSLKLNGDKTELMLLGNGPGPRPEIKWPGNWGPPPIPKASIKNLGMWLDQNLTMETQAKKHAGTCFGILRMIRKVLSLLPDKSRRTVVQALVVSRLHYGNSLYLGSPKWVTDRLQVVQNAADRLLLKIPRHQSVRSSLRELHWLPIQARVKFKALCVAHKAMHGRGPTML